MTWLIETEGDTVDSPRFSRPQRKSLPIYHNPPSHPTPPHPLKIPIPPQSRTKNPSQPSRFCAPLSHTHINLSNPSLKSLPIYHNPPSHPTPPHPLKTPTPAIPNTKNPFQPSRFHTPPSHTHIPPSPPPSPSHPTQPNPNPSKTHPHPSTSFLHTHHPPKKPPQPTHTHTTTISSGLRSRVRGRGFASGNWRCVCLCVCVAVFV